MQKTRRPILGGWLAGLGVALAAMAAGPASAIGFGSGNPLATLGQPLDISVPLRLEPGEDLDPECVAAEVSIGDTVVPPSGVGAMLVVGAGGPRAIRVRTLQRIDEPVVTVQVSAGCGGQRLTRRFVVFADPPTLVAPPVLAEAAPAPRAAEAAPVPAERPAVATAPAPAASAARPPRPRARKPEAEAAPVRQAQAPRPRLRLEAAPPPPPPPAAGVQPDEAMAAVEAANEAVKAAIAAASASQGRIGALEAEVRRLAGEASSQRETIDLLRSRASQAEGRNQWTLWLALGWLMLLAVAFWLWRRLRALEADRRQGWLDAARPAAPPPPAPPAPPPASQVPLLVERGLRQTGIGALGAGLAPVHRPTPSEYPEQPTTVAQNWHSNPETMAMRTQPLVPHSPPPPPPPVHDGPRDVSAEELIDLEQQAEFFVVLGQDEAAIDLLVAHLRDTGGASPLPYLKLLDIYRRRGEREAYERTRDRFNHRFNAHVPGWDAPATEGRSLEDYPAVMHWLEQVWPRPLDAMAELESLLFRKDGGELFELPAYRELLLLYSLARDLLDASTGGAGHAVDVLLPLSDGPAFAPTSPRPYFGDDGPVTAEMQPTAPIDLDLDTPGTDTLPDSRFGRLN